MLNIATCGYDHLYIIIYISCFVRFFFKELVLSTKVLWHISLSCLGCFNNLNTMNETLSCGKYTIDVNMVTIFADTLPLTLFDVGLHKNLHFADVTLQLTPFHIFATCSVWSRPPLPGGWNQVFWKGVQRTKAIAEKCQNFDMVILFIIF